MKFLCLFAISYNLSIVIINLNYLSIGFNFIDYIFKSSGYIISMLVIYFIYKRL